MEVASALCYYSATIVLALTCNKRRGRRILIFLVVVAVGFSLSCTKRVVEQARGGWLAVLGGQIHSAQKIFMDERFMDASIELGFSLELLKKYRKDGLLQAFVPRIPGISGKCHVEVTVMQGDVVSCRAKNQQGQIHNVDINLLLKLDEIRGPFAWKLFPSAQREKRDTSTTQPLPQYLSEQDSGSGIRPITGRTTQPLPQYLSERDSGSGIRPITGRTTRPLSSSLLQRFEQYNGQPDKSSHSPIPRVTARLNFSQASSWTPGQKQALISVYSLIDGNRCVDDIKQVVNFSPQTVEEILRVLVWIGVIAISPPPNA